MSENLANWNATLEGDFEHITTADRVKAGGLLPIIPNRQQWDEFVAQVRTEWRIWGPNLWLHRYCLVTLYGGWAFYEYSGGKFWPQFQALFGGNEIVSPNQMNLEFAEIAKELGLRILERDSGNDYVGSAIYLIGVPLSFWDGFLEVCEWAWWQDDWKGRTKPDWDEAVARRAGSRIRLTTFLQENRESASELIQEMHDARRILTEDEHLTISDLQQACILRQEYFDEVPETAEFLRPSNPQSLFQDRARLIWDEPHDRICLYLPGVARDKLPAVWKIGALTQAASPNPDAFTVNAAAFSPQLLLQLESGEQRETQRLQGVFPWGLFDVERKRFVNPERQLLPLSRYALISSHKFDNLSRKGFDEEENPANEPFELEDGSACYVTRLWPTGKIAELSFTLAGVKSNLGFRSKLKIEARVFGGEGSYAANFRKYQDQLKFERLPLLCLAIPTGYFRNTDAALQNRFEVSLDGHPTDGYWEKRHEDAEREFYFWRWADTLQPHGQLNLAINAAGLGIRFEYRIEMLAAKGGMDESWRQLPGAYLPMILLAQPAIGKREGMTWDDLMLAKDAIAADQRGFSEFLLFKYLKLGILDQKGQSWMIAESRAVFQPPSLSSHWRLLFCGDPTVLWKLFRYIKDKPPKSSLPIVEVVNRRGEPPFLEMLVKEEYRKLVERYLRENGVRFVADLWRPE